MSDIGTQLERLKSPNKNTRYEACEELRVAESLPQEALMALELAANDQGGLVADAARRALLTHRLPPSPTSTTREASEAPPTGKSRLKNPTMLSLLAITIGLASDVGAFVAGEQPVDLGCHPTNLMVLAGLAVAGVGTWFAAVGGWAVRDRKSKGGCWLSVAGILLFTVAAALCWVWPRYCETCTIAVRRQRIWIKITWP